MATPVGRVLGGRYQVDDLLGSGGMATVWRGRDLRLDRAVAIKELAEPWLGDRSALRQFDREARMAARLAHPNIVAIHDVDIHHRTPFIVMELIEGETVARLLTDDPLPIEAVVAIAAQVGDGLAAAHAAGVIHRDIKPANLMLTHAGIVKICDFGIAKGLFGVADATATGPFVAVGTSRYMAPEQASGGPVDARADLYALGCTMYAMLTGTPPFQGTVAEVLQQHQFQPPVPVRARRADVPVPLDALVMRLLAKDPGHRPTLAQIKAVLADLTPDTTPALIPMSASANVGMARAAVPVVRPRTASAASDPPRPGRSGRPRVVRYWPFAIALITLLILAPAAWRMVPHWTGESGAIAPPPTASPTTTPVIPSAPASSAAAPTKAGPASHVPRPPAATSSSPTPPGDPIAALRLAIQQQVSTGNLNPDKASPLYQKVDAIAHAANTGNTNDEANQIKAFKDSLLPLRTGGQLTPAGYNTLSADADAISATLP